MLALVLIQTVVIVILTVLVAGLLRSHAEILRALHQLGAGSGAGVGPVPVAAPGRAPVREPAGPNGDVIFDVSGSDPWGGQLHVGVGGTGRTTLLAFLSGGCTTCASFWDEFGRVGGPALPAGIDRLVIVTRSLDRESPGEIAARAPRPDSGITVVMSTEAWGRYKVPVTPYFILIDGASDRIAGEGAAQGWPQLESLLQRALVDGDMDVPGAPGARGQRGRADAALHAAGILPGHPSLAGRPTDPA